MSLTQLPIDYTRWQQRYESLRQSIETVRENMVAWADAQPKSRKKDDCNPLFEYSRAKTYVSLTRALQGFSQKQFELLHDGFKKETLEPAGNLPVDFVLRRMSDQMAHDVMLLQMAWHQRIAAPVDSNCAQTLRLADKLCFRALERAVAHKVLPDESTTISYLQKAASARVVPYAPVAMIGIPYASVGNYEGTGASAGVFVDMLAIPHEVGHYVYRHGRYQGSAIPNRVINALTGNNAALAGWAEEVFADVYGTLIAGPVIALDFQDLMIDNNPVDLFYGDGVHPYAAIRPFIYIDTLRTMDALLRQHKRKNTYELRTAALLLEARWHTVLNERGYDYDKLTFLHKERKRIQRVIAMTLADLLDMAELDFDHLWSTGEPVEKVMQEKLSGVPTTLKKLMKALSEVSEGTRDEILKGGYIYDAFGEWLGSAEFTTPPELVMSDGEPKSVMDRCKKSSDISWAPTELIGLVRMWNYLIAQMQAAIQEGQPFAGEKIPPELWSQTAIKSGWIRVGPEHESDPKLGPEHESDPKLGPEHESDPKIG